MKVRLSYCRYVANYYTSWILQLGLAFIKHTDLGLKYKPRIIAQVMKLLREDFPPAYVAPAYIRLSYEEYIKVMAPISEPHFEAVKAWIAKDFAKFVKNRNRAIEKGLEK